MIRKTGKSPPVKITYKNTQQSPRNAPQEVIVSDTSLGNNIEEQGNNGYRQTAKFYSPQYRGSQFVKAKSPVGGKDKRMSSAQQQALMELEKAKQNVAKSSANTAEHTVHNNQPWKSNVVQYQNSSNNVRSVAETQGARYVQPGDVYAPSPPYSSNYQSNSGKKSYGPRERTEYGSEDFQKIYTPEGNQGNYYGGGEQRQVEHNFPNGDRYSGSIVGKSLEGSGVYDFTKQNLQYRGQFKNSRQHGKGTLLRKPAGYAEREDVIYQGEWMNGYKEGYGVYYYFKDTYYEGNWIRNEKQGRGTFKSPEGEFQGLWKNDKKHGCGKMVLANGTVLEGQWQYDQYISGDVKYSNGDHYSGEMSQNQRDGYGSYHYANNSTEYKGKWKNNVKNGDCSIRYYNGDLYDGQMVDGRREGCEQKNKYLWRSTGDQIQAEFVGDEPVKGRIQFADGREFQFHLKGQFNPRGR